MASYPRKCFPKERVRDKIDVPAVYQRNPLSQSAIFHLPDSHMQSLRTIEKGYWWYLARIEWAKRMIRDWVKRHPQRNSLNYVDLGCGTGGFATDIKSGFGIQKVALVDGDPNILAHIRNPGQVELLRRDLSRPLNLPWQPHLITCMDVLEHLENDEILLEEIYRALPPGGLLVLSVPAGPWMYSQWDRVLGHYRRYTRTALKAKLIDCGLTIFDLQYMWSFLVPLAPYRFFIGGRFRKNSAFEKTPKWVNAVFLRLSDVEWSLSRLVTIPCGTSVIASAIKL